MADQSSGNAVGLYVYQTTVDLTGFDPSSAVVTGRLASDNLLQDVLINGVSTGISNVNNEFVNWTPFSISSGFQVGLNTIDFIVNNGGGPTGLRVEETLRVSSVPPKTIPPNVSGDGVEGGDFFISFNLDTDTAPYPTPFEPKAPLGGLIYDPDVALLIQPAGDTDSLTIDLDAGQTMTVVVDPAVGLQPTIELLGPSGGAPLGSVSAESAGLDTVLQTVAATSAGTYSITVGAVAGPPVPTSCASS